MDSVSSSMWSKKRIFLVSFIFVSLYFLENILIGFGAHSDLHTVGDALHLWALEIYNSLSYTKLGVFQGIDYYTLGGASEFFLRPNILTFHPLVLFSSLFVKLDQFPQVFSLMFFLVFSHSIAGMYSAYLFCRDFVKLNNGVCFFVATAYMFSYQLVRAEVFLPFYLIASLFPIILYSVSSHLQKNRSDIVDAGYIFSALPYSLPIVLCLVSGYVPLAVISILCSFLFLVWQNYKNGPKYSILGILFRTALPYVWATLICLPLYLEILSFVRQSSTVPKTINISAYDLAISPVQILQIFSQNLTFNFPIYEFEIRLGLVVLSILVLNFSLNFNKEDTFKADDQSRLEKGCLLITFSACLLAMGKNTALATLYYYLFPGISEMHIYQRYFGFLSLFFSIFVGFVLTRVATSTSRLWIKWSAAIWIVIFFLCCVVLYLAPDNRIVGNQFLAEMLIVICSLMFMLYVKRENIAYVFAIALFLVNTNYRINFFSNIGWTYNANKVNTIVLHPEELESVKSYFKTHSEKEVIKYVDLQSDFGSSYIPKNIPWLLKNDVHISSYYGYEPHISNDKDYQVLMGYVGKGNSKFAFKPSWEWVDKTDGEFAIYDKETLELNPEAMEHVDASDREKVLNIGDRVFIAPLLSKKKAGNYSNGVFRIDGSAHVNSFKWNKVNVAELSYSSTDVSKVSYLFWPNKKLKFYLDQEKVEPKLEQGLYAFDLPAGDHTFKVTYNNNGLVVFLMLYVLYFLGLFFMAFLAIKKKYFRESVPV